MFSVGESQIVVLSSVTSRVLSFKWSPVLSSLVTVGVSFTLSLPGCVMIPLFALDVSSSPSSWGFTSSSGADSSVFTSSSLLCDESENVIGEIVHTGVGDCSIDGIVVGMPVVVVDILVGDPVRGSDRPAVLQ